MTIDLASRTTDALRQVDEQIYDVIITDMYRAGESGKAAYTLLGEFAQRKETTPVILYTDRRTLKGDVPGSLFASTSRSDGLVQYVIDAMEHQAFA
jgi:DNA-binding NtrC family response regulator